MTATRTIGFLPYYAASLNPHDVETTTDAGLHDLKRLVRARNPIAVDLRVSLV